MIASRCQQQRVKNVSVTAFERERQLCLARVFGLQPWGGDAQYQAAVRAVDQRFKTGSALRLKLEEILDPDFEVNVTSLLQVLGCELSTTDIVLDLEDPNFDPIANLVALVTLALTSSAFFQSARSLTIAGTLFPDSMGKVQSGAEIWPRREWELYNLLISQHNPQFRIPAFGDYTSSHNSLFEGDMRLIKPSATIRYAIHDAWLIVKGILQQRERIKQKTLEQRRLHHRQRAA